MSNYPVPPVISLGLIYFFHGQEPFLSVEEIFFRQKNSWKWHSFEIVYSETVQCTGGETQHSPTHFSSGRTVKLQTFVLTIRFNSHTKPSLQTKTKNHEDFSHTQHLDPTNLEFRSLTLGKFFVHRKESNALKLTKLNRCQHLRVQIYEFICFEYSPGQMSLLELLKTICFTSS